jgi:multiple sugar transport system permease protein
MKKRLNGWPIVFIGPHMLLFLLFFLVPAVIGIYVSFTEWDLFSTPIFVGFDNFQTILFDQDSLYHTQFFNGMKNTLFFAAISVPLCIVIPLLLAVALSAKPKMMRFFQSILYLPTLFAISAVMIILGVPFEQIFWANQRSIRYRHQFCRHATMGMDRYFDRDDLVDIRWESNYLCCCIKWRL